MIRLVRFGSDKNDNRNAIEDLKGNMVTFPWGEGTGSSKLHESFGIWFIIPRQVISKMISKMIWNPNPTLNTKGGLGYAQVGPANRVSLLFPHLLLEDPFFFWPIISCLVIFVLKGGCSALPRESNCLWFVYTCIPVTNQFWRQTEIVAQASSSSFNLNCIIVIHFERMYYSKGSCQKLISGRGTWFL